MKKNQRVAKNKHRGNPKKCPLEIGDEYEVNITETTPNGTGITKIKGFLTLVDDTKSGDNVKIKITKIDPLNAEAELL